jgi:hypothetical protein
MLVLSPPLFTARVAAEPLFSRGLVARLPMGATTGGLPASSASPNAEEVLFAAVPTPLSE